MGGWSNCLLCHSQLELEVELGCDNCFLVYILPEDTKMKKIYNHWKFTEWTVGLVGQRKLKDNDMVFLRQNWLCMN